LEKYLPPSVFWALCDAARFEPPLDIVDNIADVDIATSRYASVDDVFWVMGVAHFNY
jgi:hypothetical protein